ncbi:MAG: serine protease [Elusimicrobiota bacterium]
MKRTLKATLALSVISAMFSTASFAYEKSIYGNDDRVELFSATPKISELADSVVSFWSSAKVQYDSASNTFSLKTVNFGDAYKLCAGEKFREQPMGAFCSGSLVGDDLIMTAGHCITDQAKCDDTKIVFGFALKDPNGEATTKMGQEAVYSCKKIITRFLGSEPGSANPEGQRLGPDYALIQLDRKVTGHKPLAINRGQNLKKGAKMMVIGHPVGLPLKIAASASIRDASPKGYFVADLDTFGGNSGSPVFNSSTNLIEGILVRGDEDFKSTPDGCTTVATYPQNGGRGEDVTKVSVLESFIPKPGKESESAEIISRDVQAVIEIPEGQEDFNRRFEANFQ